MEYDFTTHVSDILFEVNELAIYAELGGWRGVCRELEAVRRSLEGIGAELSGHSVSIADGAECGEVVA